LKHSILVVIALASCGKSADVKCGAGTVLNGSQCVAVQGSAQGSAQPQPAHEQGSGSAQPAAIAANEPAKPAGPQWSFRTDKDKMRDKSVYFAVLHSSDSEMGITIRQGQPGSAFGLDVILELAHGQFQCSFEGCSYAVKFDSGPIEHWQMTNAEGLNGQVLFIHNAQGFVEKLRKAHTLIIEIDRFQAGIAQISFDVPPLDGWEGLGFLASPSTASHGHARSTPPTEAVCTTIEYEFDQPPKQTLCATTDAACEKVRQKFSLTGAETIGGCTKFSPAPCIPDESGICAAVIKAQQKKGAMDDYVEKNNADPDSPMTVHVEGQQ
jgi:hypothetical protein